MQHLALQLFFDLQRAVCGHGFDCLGRVAGGSGWGDIGLGADGQMAHVFVNLSTSPVGLHADNFDSGPTFELRNCEWCVIRVV